MTSRIETYEEDHRGWREPHIFLFSEPVAQACSLNPRGEFCL